MLKYILGIAGLLLAPMLAFASVGITLTGGNVTVSQGQTYNEPGYSAFSTFDGNITSNVAVSGVDTSVGSHTISYNVTDSNLDSASAFRTLTVLSSGSLMPFCSGPMAPGWNVGLSGGGCGGTGMVVMAGASLPDATKFGGTKTCPFWFPSGCMVK